MRRKIHCQVTKLQKLEKKRRRYKEWLRAGAHQQAHLGRQAATCFLNFFKPYGFPASSSHFRNRASFSAILVSKPLGTG